MTEEEFYTSPKKIELRIRNATPAFNLETKHNLVVKENDNIGNFISKYTISAG